MIWASWAALAQPAPNAGTAIADDTGADEVDDEVWVVAERRLAVARDGIHRTLKERGHVRIWRLGQRSWYLNSKLWKPGVVVHDQGFVRMRGRPALPLFVPASPTPGDTVTQIYDPYGSRELIDEGMHTPPPQTFLLQHRSRIRNQKARLAADLEPWLAQLRDAHWGMARAQRQLALRDALSRAWFDGLDEVGQPLDSYRSRRAALAARWLDTADGTEGDWARSQIEAFIDEEVQGSDHPFRPDEIAQIQRDSPHQRPFVPLEG